MANMEDTKMANMEDTKMANKEDAKMASMNEDFRISLAAARVDAGLSRKKVSEMTGISYVKLGNIETGKTEPRGSDLQKLCHLYNINLENLRFDNIAPIKSAKRRAK